jgi:ATP-dependent DNA ligase
MLSSVTVRATIPKVCEEPLDSWLQKNSIGPYSVERKIDGERLQVEVVSNVVSYANRHSFIASNGDLPKLSGAILEAVNGRDCWLDGELSTGVRTDFYGKDGYLANRANRDDMNYIVFDVLMLEGEDLRLKPYMERRRILTELIVPNVKVELVEAWQAQGKAEIVHLYDKAVAEGQEGVVVKPYASIYTNNAWLKMKHSMTADLVILGVDKLKDAFLIGHYQANPCGFIQYGRTSAHDWQQVKQTALKAVTSEDNDYWYVEPFIVVEIRHNGLISSDEGKSYRHPRLTRIRLDKSPKDCIVQV